jgi:branched-chain amino acid transport system permease protein
VPVAVVVAGILSLPISFLAFRLSGGYFAIGTWVIAEVIYLLTSQIQALGAGAGISFTGFKGYKPEIRIAIVYWIALGAVVLAVTVTYLLLRSRLGAGFTAVRDDETAAATLGVNVTRSKRIVWVVAAMGCGLAGAILAMITMNVQPGSVFGVKWTAAMLFIVIIGGIGTIEGPILGAIIYFALEKWIGNIGVWYLIILGVIAIAVVLFFPKGLWGLVSGNGRIRLFPTGYRLVMPTRPAAPVVTEPTPHD